MSEMFKVLSCLNSDATACFVLKHESTEGPLFYHKFGKGTSHVQVPLTAPIPLDIHSMTINRDDTLLLLMSPHDIIVIQLDCFEGGKRQVASLYRKGGILNAVTPLEFRHISACFHPYFPSTIVSVTEGVYDGAASISVFTLPAKAAKSPAIVLDHVYPLPSIKQVSSFSFAPSHFDAWDDFTVYIQCRDGAVWSVRPIGPFNTNTISSSPETGLADDSESDALARLDFALPRSLRETLARQSSWHPRAMDWLMGRVSLDTLQDMARPRLVSPGTITGIAVDMLLLGTKDEDCLLMLTLWSDMRLTCHRLAAPTDSLLSLASSKEECSCYVTEEAIELFGYQLPRFVSGQGSRLQHKNELLVHAAGAVIIIQLMLSTGQARGLAIDLPGGFDDLIGLSVKQEGSSGRLLLLNSKFMLTSLPLAWPSAAEWKDLPSISVSDLAGLAGPSPAFIEQTRRLRTLCDIATAEAPDRSGPSYLDWLERRTMAVRDMTEVSLRLARRLPEEQSRQEVAAKELGDLILRVKEKEVSVMNRLRDVQRRSSSASSHLAQVNEALERRVRVEQRHRMETASVELRSLKYRIENAQKLFRRLGLHVDGLVESMPTGLSSVVDEVRDSKTILDDIRDRLTTSE